MKIPALTLAIVSSVVATAFAQPNVLVVMTDDQGYPEHSVHGNSILQASLFVSGHNHLSIGEKRSYQFEGLTKRVGKADKGTVFTMNLKKGPAALHTWFRGKDTILSAYYVYVNRIGDPN